MDGQPACGYLVKRGCFIWRPHPCASFIKKLCSPSWFTPLVNTNQRCSHIILQTHRSSPCPPSLFCRGLPPPAFHADTLEKQVSDSERQAEAEKLGGRNLLLCCSAASLCERKSSPGTKRAPSFVQGSTWGLFLLRWYRPPLSHDPTPVVPFPTVLTPFIVFPLLLICPWMYFKRLAQPEKILKNDKKRSAATTWPKVSCQKQTCVLQEYCFLALENCHGNHTTSCSEGSQDKAKLPHAVLVPTHEVSLLGHISQLQNFQMSHGLSKLKR